MQELRIFPVVNFPLIKPGDDLAQLIVDLLHHSGEALQPGDILVIAQKVVSKSEGRLVRLADVEPSEKAMELAGRLGKDPRAPILHRHRAWSTLQPQRQ